MSGIVAGTVASYMIRQNRLLGAHVLSTLAATAAERADVKQDTLKFAEAAIAESKREGLSIAANDAWYHARCDLRHAMGKAHST